MKEFKSKTYSDKMLKSHEILYHIMGKNVTIKKVRYGKE